MDENKWDTDTLQAMLNYYRNKSNQLEYEFLLYKTISEKTTRELSLRIEELYNSTDFGNTSDKDQKKGKPDAKGFKKSRKN
jgi:hypothetical protein